MKRSPVKIFSLTVTGLFVAFISSHFINFGNGGIYFGVAPVWAGGVPGCDGGQGKITLDASKSPLSGSGTVWSNNNLTSGSGASKDAPNVAVSGSNVTTIINTDIAGNGLAEDSSELATSSATYANLDNAGGLAPMDFFSDPSGQLFDFNRYNAAAEATGNVLDWTTFSNNVTNGTPMTGIIYVNVPDNGGTDLELNTGSINVKGTLVFNIQDPDPGFKVKVLVPLNVNPVDSPTNGTTTLTAADFDAWTAASETRTSVSDPFPWPSGYNSSWSEVASYNSGGGVGDKDPRGKTLTGGYPSFTQNEDMPAIMYTGGVVDMHHSTNISGLVYTPDFVEIEQKSNECYDCVQYVNGAIVAGGGIFLESNSCGGGIGVIFDPETVDFLNVVASPGSISRQTWRTIN